MEKPKAGTYPKYYDNYLSLIKTNDVLEGLEKQISITEDFLIKIPIEKESFCYTEGKWSIKELICHVIDTERIMSYRILAIARGEKSALPGFDENIYAENSHADGRTMQSLIDEYKNLRLANIILYKSFTAEMLDSVGIANDFELTPRAIIAFSLAHEMHHINVLQERYL